MNDLKRTNLWIVNDVVCSLAVERVSYPSVNDVRNNWRFSHLGLKATDDEIQGIIDRVRKIDFA